MFERHWNGDLLDTRGAVVQFAEPMTWNGKHPTVRVLTDHFPKGVRLPKHEIRRVEKEVQRLPCFDD